MYKRILVAVENSAADRSILAHVSGMWIAIGTIIALGLGIMLAVSAGKPTITQE